MIALVTLLDTKKTLTAYTIVIGITGSLDQGV